MHNANLDRELTLFVIAIYHDLIGDMRIAINRQFLTLTRQKPSETHIFWDKQHVFWF